MISSMLNEPTPSPHVVFKMTCFAWCLHRYLGEAICFTMVIGSAVNGLDAKESFGSLLLTGRLANAQVLGERELLRNEVMAELTKAAGAEGGPKFLHIMVKLADIESVCFNTFTGSKVHGGQGAARPKSALTAALAGGSKEPRDVEDRYALLRLSSSPDNIDCKTGHTYCLLITASAPQQEVGPLLDTHLHLTCCSSAQDYDVGSCA